MSKTHIIHITDLHFPHEAKNQNVDDKSGILTTNDHEFHSFRKNFLDQLEDLKKTHREHEFVLVVTGDLTSKYKLKGLQDSKSFLNECSKALGISRDRVVVSPGNHDYERILNKKKSQSGFLTNFKSFCTPLSNKKYWNNTTVGIIPVDSMDFAEEKIESENKDGIKSVGFFKGLVSTLFRGSEVKESEKKPQEARLPKIIEAPKIGKEEGCRVATVCDSWTSSKIVKIIAIHHHLVPVYGIETKPYEALIDAGTFIQKFNKLNVSIVLHGHKHERSVRFIQDLDSQNPQGFYIIGGNSFVYNNGAFNHITIDNTDNTSIHMQGFQIQNGNYIPVGKAFNLSPANVVAKNVSSLTIQGKIEL